MQLTTTFDPTVDMALKITSKINIFFCLDLKDTSIHYTLTGKQELQLNAALSVADFMRQPLKATQERYL